MPELDVDLDDPPEDRWRLPDALSAKARAMLDFYVRDLGAFEAFAPLLAEYRDAFVDAEYVAEMRGIARALDVREEHVLAANLYCDAIKLVGGGSGALACTAFAIATPAGPLHARNLDWTSANGLLSSQTIVANFRPGSSDPLYRVVTWPGFVGCLSGLAPGRFAVTLNAVLSDDPPELAAPITFVLRKTLENAGSFAAAVTALRDSVVASDSLLLVSGCENSEMAVVERAPKRAAVREPLSGAVVVTNDYRALSTTADAPRHDDALSTTSCGRFGRATELVRQASPVDAEMCFGVLRDRGVMMGITVQHMVFSARTGAVRVVLPS